MGCCNSAPPNTSEHQINNTNKSDFLKEKLDQNNPTSEDKELVDKAVKIQAHYRGHKVRKNQQEQTNKPKTNEHEPDANIASLIEEMPELKNAQVLAALKKCGEYSYSGIDKQIVDLPTLGPYELSTGSVYYGQWKFGKNLKLV